MKPINKPMISNPPHSRDPNKASPAVTPSKTGNNLKSDKDYTKWSSLSPQEVNQLHTRDDVDVRSNSHHHTLGPGHAQASPGDHIHNGTTSKKIGQGDHLTITGAKGGNVALTNLLAFLANYFDFNDTTT